RGNVQAGIQGRAKYDVGKQRHDQPIPRSDRCASIQNISDLQQIPGLRLFQQDLLRRRRWSDQAAWGRSIAAVSASHQAITIRALAGAPKMTATVKTQT